MKLQGNDLRSGCTVKTLVSRIEALRQIECPMERGIALVELKRRQRTKERMEMVQTVINEELKRSYRIALSGRGRSKPWIRPALT